ncbi:MAG: hemolysin III family protein [Thermoguttaceae bacterium]|nr:hemolysin III family protein [Thermoguttaceae bacterium]
MQSASVSSAVSEAKMYSFGEELANSITHGVGTALSIAALVLLIVRAVTHAPPGLMVSYVVGFIIYGLSLIVLYACSTIYHAMTSPKWKNFFAILDHSAIYILIAGSYTALSLSVLHGRLGWIFFGIVWALAILGIVLYAIYQRRAGKISMCLYLLMGWLAIFAVEPIYEKMSTLSFYLLCYGGIAYTLGCIFYAIKKIPWMHPVWHLFVLAGSILQFFAIYFAI